MFNEQLARIREKLVTAKAQDPEFDYFGADTHEYQLNEPATDDVVEEFERRHQITLPRDYVTFLTLLGHGGAGPYYGIYELGDFGYMVGNETTLALPCVVNSRLTAERWKELTAFDEVEQEHGDEYYRKCDELFVGMLPIGTQGCSFQTMLILNGDCAGRIVNIDQDLQMPIVADEKNFLDWYEAWLDKVLSASQKT